MRGIIALVASVTALVFAATPAFAGDERAVLLSTASQPMGARYQVGAEGPSRFDCSGYVWYVFDSAGLGDRIGGKRMRAREYQAWLRKRGALYTDKTSAQVGDLAFWGSPAVHVGIVTKVTRPKPKVVRVFVTGATTTLGVREVRYDLLVASRPFSGFGHVDLVNVPDPTPTPTPTHTNPYPHADANPDPDAGPDPSDPLRDTGAGGDACLLRPYWPRDAVR